jgi:ubiquinone/menaquinone biosynthesis C-methylase UbiE
LTATLAGRITKKVTLSNREIITEAFTELAPRYEEVVDKELQRFWGWSYDGFVDVLINELSMQTGDVVLDIATGTSVIPLKIAEAGKLAGKVVGLDITPAMLFRGREKIREQGLERSINLVCASAMRMPIAPASFDAILCGLAIHHLDLDEMLIEAFRLLKTDGTLTIGDVGGSSIWKIPGVKLLLRVGAFFYFWWAESSTRAWAEATAVSSIFTEQEWFFYLSKHGFEQIEIKKLVSKHFWAPDPLIISAKRI